MYERFLKEQFGLDVDFQALGERLGIEAAGVLFAMTTEYHAEYQRTKRYIEGVAEVAHDAAEYMNTHNRPYDLYALPAISLEHATRTLVSAHKALKQALTVAGLLAEIS